MGEGEMEKTKKCSRCRKELPREEFGKCSSCKGGLQYYCKCCQRAYRDAKFSSNMKRCDACGKLKPRDTGFYLSRITDDGLYGTCRECCITCRPREGESRRDKSHYGKVLAAALESSPRSRGKHGPFG